MTDLTTASTSPLSPWLEKHPKLDGISIMDHLFNRFDGMYMTKFRKDFQTPQAINNWRTAWAEGFAEEKITLGEIAVGIAFCRKHFDWAPSLTEFIKACRPSLDYELAFDEAVEQMALRRLPLNNGAETTTKDLWSNPAIYWAAVALGTDLDAYQYRQIKNRWQRAMDKALRYPKGPVPVFRLALPPAGKATTTKAEARKHLDMLAEISGRVKMPERVKSKISTPEEIEQRRRDIDKLLAEARVKTEPEVKA